RLNAAGQLDPTFGSGGIVNVGQGDNARVTVQADGKLVLTYTNLDIFVTRLLTNGATDTGFATGGTASLPWSLTGSDIYSSAVAVDPLGRIVVGGRQEIRNGSDSAKMLIARFTSSGALDPTFGVGGFNTSGAALNLHQGREVALALQPDGKAVLAGNRRTHGAGPAFPPLPVA